MLTRHARMNASYRHSAAHETLNDGRLTCANAEDPSQATVVSSRKRLIYDDYGLTEACRSPVPMLPPLQLGLPERRAAGAGRQILSVKAPQ